MRQVLFFLYMLVVLGSCSENKVYEVQEGIYILDKKQAIETFDELCQSLDGKPFFLDRWASWCAPCLEEFGHLEALHGFLEKKQLPMVYLNSDGEDLDEKAWMDLMVKHKLKGYHLRLDSALTSDMAQKLIFIPLIPQYLIVGKEGEIVEKDALRPSAGEALHKQIEEALGL